MQLNLNCCGNHCREEHGEVRVYPLGSGGNLILCHACWAHENKYRRERADDYVFDTLKACRLQFGPARDEVRTQAKKQAAEDWPQVNWNTAEKYGVTT